MQTFTYEQHKLTKTNTVTEALALAGAPVVSCRPGHKPYVVAFTGSGGKTSLILQIAREAAALGRNVFIVTTTHMARPQHYGVLTADPETIISQMGKDHIVIAGLPAGEKKISFIGQDTYETVCVAADIVLVEADGSKQLPLKAFGTHEPVIPDNADAVLCIAGLSALGQNLQDVFFRWDVAKQAISANGDTIPPEIRQALTADNTIVTPQLLGYFWQQCCLLQLPYKLQYQLLANRAIPIIPVLNQADTAAIIKQAVNIFENLNLPTGLITCCCPPKIKV